MTSSMATGCPENAAYHVVWCHERCHKSENLAVRQGLAEGLAMKSGGAGGLVCFKKAHRFAMWIARATRPSYTLVTNWREAQPCATAIMQNAGQNRPQKIIIIADTDRQAHRATAWAKRQPAELGEVQVFEASNIPRDIMGGFLHEHFSAAMLGGSDEEEKKVPEAEPMYVHLKSHASCMEDAVNLEGGSAMSTSAGEEDSDSLNGTEISDGPCRMPWPIDESGLYNMQGSAQYHEWAAAAAMYPCNPPYLQAFGPYEKALLCAAPSTYGSGVDAAHKVELADLAWLMAEKPQGFQLPPGLTLKL
eukprot:TRINITY_DN18695_c0_g1_i1.p1 TRINITY_DN18695_c0_g1~~TRINITY_DN18695_c0_g1_i1.p1  ORF type:complete len:305 (+),score=73.51 TRINITY_DN18695_c0_g1_i1:119-1033(+)